MTVTAHLLASGQGWWVSDVICAAGAGARPFEEKHDGFCIAAVISGTFTYRGSQGAAMMTPGSLLLGNDGGCFECGHQHSAGDRCISFHFRPDWFEHVVSGVPGASKTRFEAAHLPPLPALTPLLARVQAARDTGDELEFEELAVELAGAVVAASSGTQNARQPAASRDQKRVAEAVRWIELNADMPASLEEMAGATATSPYHFLRTFRAIASMSPYQYLLHMRLHRVAVKLRSSDEPIANVAFDAGFGDLSTFNRRFRKVMGEAPGAFRKAGLNRSRAA